MKIRYFLLSILVVAQLAGLGWMFYNSSVELADAPRDIVPAKHYSGRIIGPVEVILRHGEDCRHNNYVTYTLDRYSYNAYLNALNKYGDDVLELTLEIARRKNQPPMATRLFVNGVLFSDAVPTMIDGKIPRLHAPE